MRWFRRVRADVVRPDTTLSRDELPFLLASAVLIVVVAQWSEPGSGVSFVALVLAGLVCVARGVFRRAPSEPFVVAVVAAVGVAVGRNGELEVGQFLVVVVLLYAAWHTGSTTRSIVMTVVAAAMPWFLATVRDVDMGWLPWMAADGFMLVLGRNLRRQRLLIDELTATREALADAAVAKERQRIARELHDLAGHTLAAMMLHVTGARHVLRRDVGDAERALLDAESVGRASMDQIRAVVAALRSNERGTDAPLASGVDLSLLVEEYRRAGLIVRARIDPTVEHLDGPTAVAMYRIVRESLANVARHASTNAVDLNVNVDRSEGAGRLLVVLNDRGVPAAPCSSGGFGLVGMRERAQSLGGHFEAGPTSDGWRVSATLPLANTEAAA